jgi:hypothetical protein
MTCRSVPVSDVISGWELVLQNESGEPVEVVAGFPTKESAEIAAHCYLGDMPDIASALVVWVQEWSRLRVTRSD